MAHEQQTVRFTFYLANQHNFLQQSRLGTCPFSLVCALEVVLPPDVWANVDGPATATFPATPSMGTNVLCGRTPKAAGEEDEGPAPPPAAIIPCGMPLLAAVGANGGRASAAGLTGASKNPGG